MLIHVDIKVFDEHEEEVAERGVVVAGDEKTLDMIHAEIFDTLPYVKEVETVDGEIFLTKHIIRLTDIAC